MSTELKIGDTVVRVCMSNGSAAQVGQIATVTGFRGPDLVIVDYPTRIYKDLYPEGEGWCRAYIKLLDPVEDAKKLLESKGYNVTLKENKEVILMPNRDSATVLPGSIVFSHTRASICAKGMELLIQAFQKVKAEEERRASL